MSRVIVYLRVSTDKQETANQKFEVENFCTKRGYLVDEWIEEVMSGTTKVKDRKIGPVIENMEKGDTLIVTEISRISRNLYHIMEILKYCLDKDIKICTVKEGFVLGDDINSKILAFAFGLAAEIERNLISQRTKEALARKRAEGVVLGRPKGSRSKTVKLTGKEEVIQGLLDKKISRSAIGRILGVNRLTVSSFIKGYMADA